MERSQERGRPRQSALGLCNSRFFRNHIHIVRRNIENLVPLPQCFGEATKAGIQNRVLSEQVSVARVEPLGFVEVRLALFPKASPPRDIGQRLRNLAAIGQERTYLLKVT